MKALLAGFAVTLDHLRISSHQWRKVHIGFADLKSWGIAKPGGRGAEIEGLLGPDILEGHGALIDFVAGKLWFRPEK